VPILSALMSTWTPLTCPGFGRKSPYGYGVPIIRSVSALLHRLLGRGGSEQSESTERQRMLVRHHGVAEQRLHDGALSFWARADTSSPAPSAPAPTNKTTFFPEFRIEALPPVQSNPGR
jgi:hypothetical protein